MRTRRVPCSIDGQDVDLGAVEQVGGEEVQRQDPLRLGPQELRPARAVPPGRRVDPGALEDLPDRRRRHRDAEPGELAVDPPVAPGLVLPRQPQHHRPDVAVRRRTPGAASARHARPTGGGRCRGASADRAGSDDQPHRGQALRRQRPGEQRQPRPVRPRQGANEREAARAGRQRADGAASGSRRPSTTTPAATSPAPTRHGYNRGRSASSPQAEDHPTSGRGQAPDQATAFRRESAQVARVSGTHSQLAIPVCNADLVGRLRPTAMWPGGIELRLHSDGTRAPGRSSRRGVR